MSIDPRLRAITPASDRRLAVRVTPDALRQVRSGHPWVYDSSITSVSHDGSPGDLAVVFDRNRRFAAIGLWDPASPIRMRVLHAGRPATIDATWWSAVLDRALTVRRRFTDDPLAGQLAYRVLNGENDGVPGLVVDRYADVLVCKLYSAAWYPHLADVIELLVERTGASGVVLRLARTLQHRVDDPTDGGPAHDLADGDVVAGEVPAGPVRFLERSVAEPLSFDADVRHGQKTGHFLDQRHNRRRVGELSAGARVLDLFASAGGFGLHAAAGGAVSVDAVDLSAPTLAAAEHNVEINHTLAAVAACRWTWRVGDAFDVLDELATARRRFDLVVVDPPSFAQRAGDVRGALRAYGRLTTAALGVLAPAGVLVQASCSSRVTESDFFAAVGRAGAQTGRAMESLERTGHDTDHPVTFPEGAYLKAGFWRVT